MKIYNRKSKTYEVGSQYGGELLNILYTHCLGRILLKFVIHPTFSRIYGWYNGSCFSCTKIKPFAEKYGICIEDYEGKEYRSFNDFFTRKIKDGKRIVNMNESVLVAPADSKLSVFPIRENNLIKIKEVLYTVDELVDGRIELENYFGGMCLVFRLTMDDYHRYIFVDDGVLKRQYTIKGQLHTVSPVSKNHKIYRQNYRVVNLLETINFGTVICIEVGALLVGKINNHPLIHFHRGDEKGYFEPGGSTIIMLFQNGRINIDEDILQIGGKDVEVKVRLGEKIGSKNIC